MRISSGMIFDAGVSVINKQTADLLHTQQQLSTGKRILTPADDPVAAASALQTTQAVDITNQFSKAHDNAAAALGLSESQLQSATDVLQEVRTLAVSAGNASLTDSDRRSIATQLRANFDQLLGVANARDANGDYLYSGYMGNTQPFSGTVETGVIYQGDEGQRALQVSPSEQMAVSDSGNAIFSRIRNGNGVFAASYSPSNMGSAEIDGGTVLDPLKWNSATNSGNLEVRFWVDAGGTIGPANATYYDLVDVTTGFSLFSGGASTAGGGTNTYTHGYVSGQAINFSGLAAAYNPPSQDFGVSVTVSGTPVSGDRFSVKSSSSQSVFATLSNFILALEKPMTGGASGAAKLNGEISSMLTNVDQATQTLLTVRGNVGSRLAAIDSLKSVNSNLGLQYQQVLSSLQDVDYAKTVSDLTRIQTQLQAAQQSFVKVSQLSLFNYIS